MMDLAEGILELFTEAGRVWHGGTVSMDYKEEERLGFRAVRANDFAKKRWAAANKHKQREYDKRWRAANPRSAARPLSEEQKLSRNQERRARYAELRAAGLSRAEAARRS